MVTWAISHQRALPLDISMDTPFLHGAENPLVSRLSKLMVPLLLEELKARLMRRRGDSGVQVKATALVTAIHVWIVASIFQSKIVPTDFASRATEAVPIAQCKLT